MNKRASERGEGKGGCIVGLILFLAAIFVAYKMIPVKVKAAELRGVVVDEAKSAGTHNDKQIRASILNKANDLHLPLKDEDLMIARAASTIKIDAQYTVPLEFPGYTYMWKFQHTAENPIF